VDGGGDIDGPSRDQTDDIRCVCRWQWRFPLPLAAQRTFRTPPASGMTCPASGFAPTNAIELQPFVLGEQASCLSKEKWRLDHRHRRGFP
jgi:hypothetical protein